MEPLPLPNPKPGSFEAYERSAGILESVADKYAKGSVERELLKKAAFALFFSTVYFSEQFEDFLSKFEIRSFQRNKERICEAWVLIRMRHCRTKDRDGVQLSNLKPSVIKAGHATSKVLESKRVIFVRTRVFSHHPSPLSAPAITTNFATK